MIEVYSTISAPKELIDFEKETVMQMEEVKLRRTKQIIEELEVISKACGRVNENPWLGIKQTHYSLSLQDTLKKELNGIQTETEKLLSLDRSLADIGLSHSLKDHSWYMFIYKIIPFLHDIPDAELELIGEEQFESVVSEITKVIRAGEIHDETRGKIEERFDISILKIDAETLLQNFRLADNSWFIPEMLEKMKIKKELKKYLNAKDKIETDEIETIIKTMRDIQEKKDFLVHHNDTMNLHFPNLWDEGEGNGDWRGIEKAVQWMTDVREAIKELQPSQEWLSNNARNLHAHKTDFSSNGLKEQMKNYTKGFQVIMNHWEAIEKELLIENIHEPAKPDWANFIRNKALLLTESLPMLKDNCQLADIIKKAEEFGLKNVTKPYLSGRLENDELLSSYLFAFYRIRIDGEISASGDLSQFSKISFENKVDKFHTFDEEPSELTKLEVC